MRTKKEILEYLKDKELESLVRELIDSGVTKEQFKQFLEEKRKEKNLSN
jgi:hypothetical protein